MEEVGDVHAAAFNLATEPKVVIFLYPRRVIHPGKIIAHERPFRVVAKARPAVNVYALDGILWGLKRNVDAERAQPHGIGRGTAIGSLPRKDRKSTRLNSSH